MRSIDNKEGEERMGTVIPILAMSPKPLAFGRDGWRRS